MSNSFTRPLYRDLSGKSIHQTLRSFHVVTVCFPVSLLWADKVDVSQNVPGCAYLYMLIYFFNVDAVNIFRWVKLSDQVCSLQTSQMLGLWLTQQTKQKYQVWLVHKTCLPHHSCCSAWLNVIYLFLTWQGSYTVKLTDEKDAIRGGLVLFGVKLCNQ